MNVKAEKYINRAEKYLSQGDKELKEDDLCQVSEKYWSASAQMLKAWAVAKGIQHNGQGWLFKVVDNLIRRRKRALFKKQFGLAGMLHTNFYEGWLIKEDVEDYSLQNKEFIKKIKTLIERETRRSADADTLLTPRLPSADTPLKADYVPHFLLDKLKLIIIQWRYE
ncbi:MAG: PaREP1 family protein [bacterium]